MSAREVRYDVEIRRNRDGCVRRVSNSAWTWNEASVYYWTVGNMACDRNLAVAFGDDAEVTTHDGVAYAPLRALLATGRVVDFEASYARWRPPPVKTYNLLEMRARIMRQIAARTTSPDW